jgi:hypothetical protein
MTVTSDISNRIADVIADMREKGVGEFHVNIIAIRVYDHYCRKVGQIEMEAEDKQLLQLLAERYDLQLDQEPHIGHGGVEYFKMMTRQFLKRNGRQERKEAMQQSGGDGDFVQTPDLFGSVMQLIYPTRTANVWKDRDLLTDADARWIVAEMDKTIGGTQKHRDTFWNWHINRTTVPPDEEEIGEGAA